MPFLNEKYQKWHTLQPYKYQKKTSMSILKELCSFKQNEKDINKYQLCAQA